MPTAIAPAHTRWGGVMAKVVRFHEAGGPEVLRIHPDIRFG
jgi:hypothetical protein